MLFAFECGSKRIGNLESGKWNGTIGTKRKTIMLKYRGNEEDRGLVAKQRHIHTYIHIFK